VLITGDSGFVQRKVNDLQLEFAADWPLCRHDDPVKRVSLFTQGLLERRRGSFQRRETFVDAEMRGEDRFCRLR
jgi:hypothetical protein